MVVDKLDRQPEGEGDPKMRKLLFAVSFFAVTLVGLSARAENVDDIVALSQKNVGDDVILAVIERSNSNFELSAAEIVKLKEAKVSDRLVTAMIKHNAGGAAVAQPKVIPPAAPIAAAPAVEAPAPDLEGVRAGEGTLSIENLDDHVWSYRYEPAIQTIWISPAINGQGNVAAHGGLTLRMKAGTYQIRYNGQADGPAVAVNAGEKSLFMISRVATNEAESLYVSVFEHGQRKATGRIAVLRDGAAPQANAQPPVQPLVQPPVQSERVVERVVEVPSTTVVYRDDYSPVIYSPVYYGGYYSPYYYHPHYYPSTVGFGYSSYGHHSGISVGVGFGGGFRH